MFMYSCDVMTSLGVERSIGDEDGMGYRDVSTALTEVQLRNHVLISARAGHNNLLEPCTAKTQVVYFTYEPPARFISKIRNLWFLNLLYLYTCTLFLLN